MPHMREVKTCDRCRHFKRRCDLIKPSCSRCLQAGVRCSFDVAAATAAAAAAASSSAITVPITTPASASPSASFPPSASATAPSSNAASSPMLDELSASLSNGGLISPTTSTESPEPLVLLPGSAEPGVVPDSVPGLSTAATGQRIIRKRKRNCLSCLRCHRLKVKCDKELPCGRCKSSGNGRECYYSYNKGPNGGKFPCPTAPVTASGDDSKATIATWHVQHKVRGSSHWRDLMTKVIFSHSHLLLALKGILSVPGSLLQGGNLLETT